MARDRVFISYSHRDRRHLDRLRVHLRPSERDHEIDVWDDTRIQAGSQWREEISEALDSARVAILLVSADFLASDFVVEIELPRLLEAAERQGATIVPVILGHCRFTRMPLLSKFQAANNPDRPLAILPVAERERVWVCVAESVLAVFKGRAATEGRAVSRERRVAAELSEFTSRAAEDDFLVVSCGDYYVQFLLYPDEARFYCEAASNTYLPKERHITRKDAARLRALGFKRSPDAAKNYSRDFQIPKTQEEFEGVAGVVVKILSDVYHVSQHAELTFTDNSD